MIKATLGLAPQSATEHAPFFKHCSWKPLNFKFMPFRLMIYRGKQVVHGNLDCLHLLKRLAFHSGFQTACGS